MYHNGINGMITFRQAIIIHPITCQNHLIVSVYYLVLFINLKLAKKVNVTILILYLFLPKKFLFPKLINFFIQYSLILFFN